MITAALVNELAEAADRRALSCVVGRYSRLDLLLLDELGYGRSSHCRGGLPYQSCSGCIACGMDRGASRENWSEQNAGS